MVDGTSGNDSLDGTSGNDTINGLAGNDTLNGLAGIDSLDGGDGDDILDGGDDDDILSGGAGSDTHTGGAGCDNFLFDPISATGDVDVITDFGLGDSITIGGTGFSNQDPGAALITFIGTAAFSNTAGEVRYSTGGGETLIEVDVDGDGAADQSIQITNGEFVLRTTFNNGPTLEIDGAFGAATTGDDKIIGTSGFDSISGGDGNDFLRGMGGGDIINGGDGDDTISEDAGNDFIDGGSGTDQLNRFYGEQIDLSITDFSMFNALSSEADSLLNIERIFVSNRLAPASDDTIDGSAATIELNLHGGAGDDIIIGGENDDNIEGDSGDDTLTGGLGADTFDFDYIVEVGAAGDVITDLEFSDRIDFSLINTLGEALDPDGLDLTFIGETAFSSSAGEFRFTRSGGQTQIQFDEDGDGAADRFVTITSGEFILAETFSDSAVLQISAAASATAGADSLVGSNGADTIDGLAGDDTIQGLLGNDSLIGGDDNDLIQAGGGDDTLIGGAGADTLQGGSGNDTADYSGSSSAVRVDLNGSDISMGDAQGDVLSGIEGLVGSAFDDTLVGLSGGETLIGGDGADDISGLDGNDSIDGGDGDDALNGGAGADTIVGGAGNDTLSYASSTAVSIDLASGDASGGDAQGDSISGIENVFGGAGADTLNGNSSSNNLRGLGGADNLRGFGGNDSLEGGADADTITGDDGDDTIDGNDGADNLEGGRGSDLLRGGEGNDTLRGDVLVSGFIEVNNDTLDGGAGIDRAIIKTEVGSENDTFFTDEDNPSAGFGYIQTAFGLAGFQSLIDIEIVEFRTGSEAPTRIFELALGAATNDLLTPSLGLNFDAYGGAGNDTLVGGAGDDSLDAGAGDDDVSGGDGADTLVGGDGADTLAGGDGIDIFIVEASASVQVITDFAIGERLSPFDSAGGDLTFIGNGAFTAQAGEYRVQTGGGQTQIQIDTDGNGIADSFINLTNDEFDLRETFDGSNTLEVTVIAAATPGNDSIAGGIGDDTIDGLGGNDTITGNLGDDSLIGGDGDDSLFADRGNDIVEGGAGDDHIEGEEGDDTVTGGAGFDVFEFDTVDELGSIGDVITDLEVGESISFFRINQFGELGLDGGLELTFIGTNSFSNTVGEYRYQVGGGQTEIQFDVDGDSVADRFVIITNGEFSLGRDFLLDNLRIVTPAGTAGDDSLIGTSGNDTIDGLGGDDTIEGRFGDDVLIGGAGMDLLIGNEGADSLTGGDDDDILLGGDAADTLLGDDGDDTLFGENGDDQLFSGFGDDRADGGVGADLIRTGPGKDTLLGGADNDTLGASNRSDLLRGGDGDDLMLGSNGNDRLFGDGGNDTLLGGNGRDTLEGGEGADRLVGGNSGGADVASYAGAGAGVQVRLWNSDGTAGDALGDTLLEIENLAGSTFNDSLAGDAGANRIDGNDGDDIIQGLDGADQLIGDRGDDLLVGGAGDDTFLYFAGDGADVITDFEAGAGSDDAIRLFNMGPAFDTFAEVLAAASDVGGDAVIDFGGGDQILLQSVTVSDLHTNDFIFG